MPPYRGTLQPYRPQIDPPLPDGRAPQEDARHRARKRKQRVGRAVLGADHALQLRLESVERFAEGEAAQATVKELGRKSFWANCEEINSLLEGKNWMMGKQYSVADPYALVFYGWGVRGELPMQKLAAYTAWKERMLKRPAVRKILENEQSVLLKAA